MDTPSAASAKGPSSKQITAGLGLVVLVVGIVFAFNSSWYLHWYALFRVTHVAMAVFWVGGGLTLTILALRAELTNDANELATIARQAAFLGERFFAPAGLVVFLMGIAMMVNTN
jgi:hypothetical protein